MTISLNDVCPTSDTIELGWLGRPYQSLGIESFAPREQTCVNTPVLPRTSVSASPVNCIERQILVHSGPEVSN